MTCKTTWTHFLIVCFLFHPVVFTLIYCGCGLGLEIPGLGLS